MYDWVLYSNFFKRVFDVLFTVLLTPILLLAFIVVGIATKVEDGGPILYCGERLGLHGRPFRMYKFRSMKVNAPDWRLEDGSTFNAKDDPRQTRVGKILRKTSIDEIPQLINILKGEMSFIGPRPDTVDWLSRYSDAEKIFLDVKPGITGYNQAYFRNSVDGREKIKHDVFYAQNISLALDLKILFVTFFTVLTRKDIFKRPESSVKSDGV